MSIRTATTARPATARLVTLAVGIVCAAALVIAGAAPASAGPNPDRLAGAGWTCFEHLEAWHWSTFAGEEPRHYADLGSRRPG